MSNDVRSTEGRTGQTTDDTGQFEHIGWYVPKGGEAQEDVLEALRDCGYSVNVKQGGQLLSDDSVEIFRTEDTESDQR